MVSKTPKFSAIGKTCLTIPKKFWDLQILNETKSLVDGQIKTLHIDNTVLSLKKDSGGYFVKSDIDATKTQWRPLDVTIEI